MSLARVIAAARRFEGGRDLVHESELQRLLGRDRLGLEHHLERLGQTDESREALRAAEARDDAELELGEAELRAGVATRALHAIATSRPPPRARFSMAATVGFGPASTRR